jgi:flagellar basal body-associated protein FliL
MDEEAQELPQEQKKGSNKSWIFIVVIIGIVVASGAVYKLQKKSQDKPITLSVKTTSVSPTKKTTASVYKNGTYSAKGEYVTHVGPKHIEVKITLENDIITDADVTNQADDKVSVHFQDVFIANYKPQVIGKKITEVHLSKIASSSLTPNGFNSALQAIETQAKS